MRTFRVSILCALLALSCTLARGIQFDLGPSNTFFCLGHEFYMGQHFKGSYSVPDVDDHWDTTLTIQTPSRIVIFTRNNIDNHPGDFQLEAPEDGIYKFCFTSNVASARFAQGRMRQRGSRGRSAVEMGKPAPNTRRVEFSIDELNEVSPEFARQQREYERQAMAASKVDTSNVVSQADLHPINLVLIRTETQLERLKNEFRDFREREYAHRDTNESTNSRTVVFSLLTISALVVLALYQGYYMRSYFKKKKLI